MVYVPTFTIKANEKVGKHTNPIDPMGAVMEEILHHLGCI